jgi:hypothetical protein
METGLGRIVSVCTGVQWEGGYVGRLRGEWNGRGQIVISLHCSCSESLGLYPGKQWPYGHIPSSIFYGNL